MEIGDRKMNKTVDKTPLVCVFLNFSTARPNENKKVSKKTVHKQPDESCMGPFMSQMRRQKKGGTQ